jgi:ABC-type polysaccharide/polyol phosphate export permease
MKSSLRENLRIVWTITAKDVIEALKNRATLSALVISLLMVAFYRYLPALTMGSSTQNVLIYDAGSTSYWDALEESTDPVVYGPYPTQSLMEYDLSKGFTPELGVVIPEEFDQQLAEGSEIELDGYVMHWVGDAQAAEMIDAAEGLIAGVIGQSVRILTEGNTVYSRADGIGFALWYALGIVIGMLMIGISLVPNLMIEERHAKTIDALLISPARSGHVVIGKALTGMFYCMIIVVVAAIFSGSLVVHWWVFVLAAVVGSLLSVSIGLLMGTGFKDRQQLIAWGFFLSFPLLLPVFLSWMTGLIPDAVIAVLQWVPTVAMAKVFRVSFTEHALLGSYGLELALVLGSALALFALVGWMVRRSDR